jgi:hypothetical protein
MLRNVKSPRGPVVPLVDIAEESHREAETVRHLVRTLKLPTIQVRAKSRGNGRRRSVTCVEPKYIATILTKLAGLRRRNGNGALVERRANSAPVVPALSRDTVLSWLRAQAEQGLSKLVFEKSTGTVQFSIEQSESTKLG